MSFAAVYNVTRGIRMLLRSQLVRVSPSAVVTLVPPGEQLPATSGVNLYLYRVSESPFTKNRPWPGDRATRPSDQPPLGLTLYYLLTPLGLRPDDGSFMLGDDAHTMLGVAMRTLHENPVLNDVHLPDFDADTVLPDFVLNSFEKVKVTLMPTSIEELSKIWATINQPYRLSVAYEVSLVQVTPTAPPPINGGVVLSTRVDVITLDAPRVTGVTPEAGALAQVDGAGNLQPNPLAISGFGFRFPGQAPTVRVGGQLARVQTAPPPTDTSLTVALPTSLDAGPQEDVKVTLNGRTSTPVPFTVDPWLANVTPVRSALEGATPTITLNGSGFTGSPRAVRFEGPGGTSSVTAFISATDSRASVQIPALANGIFGVRIVLNDAQSSASNSRTLEVIPRLDSPVGVAVVVASGVSVHQLTFNGARLNGADVRVLIDAVAYQHGANANANQVVHTLGRLLNAGAYQVAVAVDGSLSHSVVLQI